MKVLMVDDEKVILTVSRQALAGIAEEIVTFTDPREALRLDLTSFDVVVSDFYMPDMGGDEFLREVRKAAPDVPFLFLTQNENLSVAVELMRQGADDYVSKPIDPTNLVFRIDKVIREKERDRQIEQILQEQRILDLENQKLVNWRLLYASKDARLTENLVSNLARSINQGGGFLWLDLLADSSTHADEDHYIVPRSVFDMAVNSARNLETLFNQVTYIGSLDTMDLTLSSISAQVFHEHVHTMITERLLPILKRYDRTFRWNTAPPAVSENSWIQADLDRVYDILLELTVNAIKFSPAGSAVNYDLIYEEQGGAEMLTLQVSSVARKLQATDDKGDHIYGIPYDFKEQVFDLFFSIEAFPEYLPEEQWTDGSGLYIGRRLMRLMNGWMLTHSGIDYTLEVPQPIVRIDVRFPLYREDSRGDR